MFAEYANFNDLPANSNPYIMWSDIDDFTADDFRQKVKKLLERERMDVEPSKVHILKASGGKPRGAIIKYENAYIVRKLYNILTTKY